MFAGAGFGIYFKVEVFSLSLKFQVAAYGGAGYNIDLELTNPSLNGNTISVPLVGADRSPSASIQLIGGDAASVIIIIS